MYNCVHLHGAWCTWLQLHATAKDFISLRSGATEGGDLCDMDTGKQYWILGKTILRVDFWAISLGPSYSLLNNRMWICNFQNITNLHFSHSLQLPDPNKSTPFVQYSNATTATTSCNSLCQQLCSTLLHINNCHLLNIEDNLETFIIKRHL